MYCPECGAEYRRGVDRCADCGSPLVDMPPPSSAGSAEGPDLVIVFAEGRQDLVAVAKSILMSAGIGFVVCGEGVQDLFGWGRFPIGTNVFIGPVQIFVSREQAADAKALLEGAWEPESRTTTEADTDPSTEDSHATGFLWRWAKPAARLTAALFLITGVLTLLATALTQLSAP